MTKDLGTFARLGQFFDNYLPLVGTVVGTIVLSFSTSLTTSWDDLITPSRWQTWVQWSGIIFFTVGTFFLSKQSLRAATLTVENQRLRADIVSLGKDIQDKWRLSLIPLFQELNLDNNCRISIYRYEDANFIMLGRFSPDPDKQRTGRGFYPSNQGCIGAAFRDKESFADLPAPDTSEYYEVMHEQWQVEPSVVTEFTMKPRSIAAFAIEEKSTYTRPMVIVFESTAEKAFSARKLRKACESSADEFCARLKELEPLLPSLRYAKQQGF